MKPGGEEHAWILRRFLNIVHWTVAHHVIEEFLLVRASPVGAATEKRSEGKKDDVEMLRRLGQSDICSKATSTLYLPFLPLASCEGDRCVNHGIHYVDKGYA